MYRCNLIVQNKTKKRERERDIRCGSTENVNDIPSKGRGEIRKSRFCEGCQEHDGERRVRVTVR